MYAVVRTGGKQLKVEPGTVADVELLDAEPGDKITLVPLLVSDEGEITTDGKALEGMPVTAEVVGHVKADKLLVFKFKKRKGYKRLNGHRQGLTRIKVTAIGEEPKKKAAPRKRASETAEATPAVSPADE
jgi:large subunit ribosomal protein L21